MTFTDLSVDLHPVRSDRPDRVGRDRLEILTALINAPSFDPMFRPDVIEIPRDDHIFRWRCVVAGCEWSSDGGHEVCTGHAEQWKQARAQGISKVEFISTAEPLARASRLRELLCCICGHRPAERTSLELCRTHASRWDLNVESRRATTDFAQWVSEQTPLPSYGRCSVSVCPQVAESPLGLCTRHRRHYRTERCPGGAKLPYRWWHDYDNNGLPVPITYTDQARFRRWCAEAPALPWPGQINLHGLQPLTRAEIKWGLARHSEQARPTRWDICWVRGVVAACRAQDIESLSGLDCSSGSPLGRSIVNEILADLRLIYFTPADTKDAGFIETDHFGIRFEGRRSHFDLTAIPQHWLRGLVWEHIATQLQSPRCPRSGNWLDGMRRAAVELGVFLVNDAPGEGHDPTLLTGEHMQRFVADHRRRAREGLASLAVHGGTGKPSFVSENTCAIVFNNVRRLLRDAVDTGITERLGLSREFIVAIPNAGSGRGTTPRRPFPDEVARALAAEENLGIIESNHDLEDRGVRDIWETLIATGRRIGEVTNLRLDCLGRYGTLPMLWHDQTKVGNYDASIRIPEHIYQRLSERQRKTVDRFIVNHGRRPTTDERARLALFPTPYRNHDGSRALSTMWFRNHFNPWVESLDIGAWVPHQARHSLATSLLRAGASLAHIRAYLGHVSDRMAEHYVHLSSSDLEDVLAQVWVAGPGTANPGVLLTSSTEAMTAKQARALAIDLSRRSTPAEGGFCTFQPVVDGGNCPWNLNCHSCDKFVLSGADLLYWQRKREQWRQLAEGAPDDATADYLHQYFEPTARAIDGLEKALAGLGLLNQALELDLRKPQDYFHRVWSIGFRAADLADADHHALEDGTP
ncbi:tyrosine-type recombinase/integrase [Nocardia fluminea]|uniref:tyrosine-type recombinase/integrase n=1 Tax=Nocardia fluminea TaxID=134984 RepID=UPI003D1469BB